ncbi:hypothetical protein ACO22_04615 [Paracoccidioides brasiliensis]|uniref:Uncharacterized protein n=1 Tax=Paracoccidioides brasiliensis TaxID=121759 RepID=A0A1D2JCM4_PARBR|nr:hypothetical protein ACO22_04615 [Paracoccidioides brasiliensis]
MDQQHMRINYTVNEKKLILRDAADVHEAPRLFFENERPSAVAEAQRPQFSLKRSKRNDVILASVFLFDDSHIIIFEDVSPYSALTQIDWISDESRALTEPKWECVTCRLQPTLSLMAFAASKLLFKVYPCLASDKESAGSQGWLGCSEYEAMNFKNLKANNPITRNTRREGSGKR